MATPSSWWETVAAASTIATRDLREFVITLQQDAATMAEEVRAGRVPDVVAVVGGAMRVDANSSNDSSLSGGTCAPAAQIPSPISLDATTPAPPAAAALARLRALDPNDESELGWGDDGDDSHGDRTSVTPATVADSTSLQISE